RPRRRPAGLAAPPAAGGCGGPGEDVPALTWCLKGRYGIRPNSRGHGHIGSAAPDVLGGGPPAWVARDLRGDDPMLLSQRLLARARVTAVAVATAVLAVLAPGAAHAATPPANDDFDHSTTIAALPFTTQEDTSGATKATDDPYWCQGSDVV